MGKYFKVNPSIDLVQGLLALISVCAVVYLSIVGKQIPDSLSGIAYAAVGFYFGQRVQFGNNEKGGEDHG